MSGSRREVGKKSEKVRRKSKKVGGKSEKSQREVSGKLISDDNFS